ncbi:hypothetical protein AAHA92_13633 [Salvia divinorum]|uniref:Uncharacterized protein n=1 Tax=Salvia divinorum TaxID=28513 RepID=A0ABD1H8V8_SALDI
MFLALGDYPELGDMDLALRHCATTECLRNLLVYSFLRWIPPKRLIQRQLRSNGPKCCSFVLSFPFSERSL